MGFSSILMDNVLSTRESAPLGEQKCCGLFRDIVREEVDESVPNVALISEIDRQVEEVKAPGQC